MCGEGVSGKALATVRGGDKEFGRLGVLTYPHVQMNQTWRERRLVAGPGRIGAGGVIVLITLLAYVPDCTADSFGTMIRT